MLPESCMLYVQPPSFCLLSTLLQSTLSTLTPRDDRVEARWVCPHWISLLVSQAGSLVSGRPNNEVDTPTTDINPPATCVDLVGCSIWSAIPQILLLLRLPSRGGPSFSLLIAWLLGDAALVAGMYLTHAPVTQKFSGM
jgi:hypothetical protein